VKVGERECPMMSREAVLAEHYHVFRCFEATTDVGLVMDF
jgi:hypothetical protein